MKGRVAAAPSATPRLPDVNVTVVLELPDGSLLPTRVEDHDDGQLYVAAVGSLGDHGTLRAGGLVVVGWTVPRGACSVECRLVREVPGHPSLWCLRPVAAVQRAQRRRFVRGQVLGAVELYQAESGRVVVAVAEPPGTDPTADPPLPTDLEASGPVVGSLLDLGEGGGQVRTGDGAGALRPGDDVRLVVLFGDHRIELVAEVVRNLPHPGGGRVLALAFDTDDATADAIRTEVLQVQIAARAKERGTW